MKYRYKISMIFWWCKNIPLHRHILKVPHLHHPVYATAHTGTMRREIHHPYRDRNNRTHKEI